MKKLFVLFGLLFCNYILPFDKRFSDFTMEYDQSEFVAKVKIKSIELSKKDKGYYDVSIEILNLFKGKKVKTFKLSYTPYDNYGLDFTKNSIWLLFASFNKENMLIREFSYGSFQIDRKMNTDEFPTIEDSFKEKVNRKIDLLNFLKNKKIKKINVYNLRISYKESCNNDLKDYSDLKQKFAVYRLRINKDLSIKKITPVKEFDNKMLSDEMLKCLNKIIKIENAKIKSIKAETDFYLIYHYYKDGEKSLITEKLL